MYEKEFYFTDGTKCLSEEVNKINIQAIYKAMEILANSQTQAANKKSVVKRK